MCVFPEFSTSLFACGFDLNERIELTFIHLCGAWAQRNCTKIPLGKKRINEFHQTNIVSAHYVHTKYNLCFECQRMQTKTTMRARPMDEGESGRAIQTLRKKMYSRQVVAIADSTVLKNYLITHTERDVSIHTLVYGCISIQNTQVDRAPPTNISAHSDTAKLPNGAAYNVHVRLTGRNGIFNLHNCVRCGYLSGFCALRVLYVHAVCVWESAFIVIPHYYHVDLR